MRRHSSSIWEKTLPSFIIAVTLGVVCLSLSIVLFSAGICFFMDDLSAVRLLIYVSLMISGTCSSMLLGKYRRHRGLLEGSLCGGLIYAVIAVYSVISSGSVPGILKLLTLLICGAAGGVTGVNSKRPKGLQ